MTEPTKAPVVQQQKQSALSVFGELTGVQGGQVYSVLKETIFKGGTDSQLQAFVGVCNQYKLNPFLRQIWAFPAKGGGIVPMVSIDGWIKIVNDNAVFDGEEFEYGPDITEGKGAGYPSFIQCTMHRKDRTRPTKIREYFLENFRNTEPWNQQGSRMLRHRAYIQCARVCFGLGGIYDPDEGERIIEGDFVNVGEASTVADLNKRITATSAPPAEFPKPAAQLDNVAGGEVLEQAVRVAETELVRGLVEEPDKGGGVDIPEEFTNPETGEVRSTAKPAATSQWDVDAVLVRVEAASTLEQAEAAARLASHLANQEERTIVGNAYADKKKRLKAGK